jgi:hypothetical protein|tara:strand:- start:559 stop:729 length:171 start_codon:yes stop_codon:yes gene_type:complete
MVIDMKLERRINNVMKAMKRTKHYDMKVIWSNKLQELLKLKERKYERIQDSARSVH